jgi:hypothetical protein
VLCLALDRRTSISFGLYAGDVILAISARKLFSLSA